MADATAWISAGAAAVQAVGAVAAIWYSGKLARDAAAREIAANDAANRRLNEAEAAQKARDMAADEAAEVRRWHDKVETHNSIVNRVVVAAQLAADQCQSTVIAAWASSAASEGTVVGGAFQNQRLSDLRNLLELVRLEAGNRDLLEALSALEDTIAFESLSCEGGAAYAAAQEAKLSRIMAAISVVESERMPLSLPKPANAG